MLCYELRQFGLDGLSLTERPRPEPAADEILIRVRAASFNYRDWLMVEGRYNPKQRLPLIPLSDGAGEVIATGLSVTKWKPGDRVAGCFFPKWHSGPPAREKLSLPLGGPADGMLTEFIALAQDAVVRLPDHLTWEEAATLPCAALTAWSALIEQGHLGPGDVVLIQGTGGVSLFGLQFALLAGARVVITSSSDEKLARARELGAHETINYRTAPDWDREARALTGGRGVSHILEVGGADTIARSLRAVCVGGTISVIGVLGGNATETSLIPILMQNVRLQGVAVGSREMFERMNVALALHHLKPVIHEVFDFQHAQEALRLLAAGAHFGKVCVRMPD